MKRIIGFIIFISMLAGCSNNSIPELSLISRYTEQELEERLLGHSQEEIISQWDEPDGMCFGMWCDIWSVSEMNVFIYYGEDGKVEKILLDEIQEPSIDKEKIYSECISGNIVSIDIKDGNEEAIVKIMGYEDKQIVLNEITEYYKYDAKSTETISTTKKEINLNDYVEIEIEGKHNQNEYNAKSVMVIENKDYLIDGTYMEVMENTITGIGRGTLQKSYEVNDEDAKQLVNILKSNEYIKDSTKCEFDYAINIKGILIYYHSECGTFTIYDIKEFSYLSSQEQEIEAISIKISNEEKEIVNNLLNKYINKTE